VLYQHELHQLMRCRLDCDHELHAKSITGLWYFVNGGW
jgi:hypothetical protein